MDFINRYTVPGDSATLWPMLMDVHQVAECLEGVTDLETVEADHYVGVMSVKMGPVRLRFNGDVRVTEKDESNGHAVLEASARDSKIAGGFQATLVMDLLPPVAPEGQTAQPENEATDLEIRLSTAFLGRIGQLGRPLIKKKINSMMDAFSNQLIARLAPSTAAAQSETATTGDEQ